MISELKCKQTNIKIRAVSFLPTATSIRTMTLRGALSTFPYFFLRGKGDAVNIVNNYHLSAWKLNSELPPRRSELYIAPPEELCVLFKSIDAQVGEATMFNNVLGICFKMQWIHFREHVAAWNSAVTRKNNNKQSIFLSSKTHLCKQRWLITSIH